MSDTQTPSPKDIIHIDMDAFYASVEVVDNPALQGQPVIVGGSMQRGVVSAASYEARRFGVHSALPVATARRLCPHGVFLPVRMDRYVEMSALVFEIFERYTPQVEALSIDEAFLDVTGSKQLYGPPDTIARSIKQAIREEIGLTASAGVAPSKFIAKIASDLEKPDGLTIVGHNCEKTFLDPLPIDKLWGVGKVTRKALSLLGIKTIGDLGRTPLSLLEGKFGKHGVHLYCLAQGIDDREVEPEYETKSIGNEETFMQDIRDPERARQELLALAVKVSSRLRHNDVQGKTITLKVKYADFVQITRSVTVASPTDDWRKLYDEGCRLLPKTEVGRRPVRLLGISVSQLCSVGEPHQLSLFDKKENTTKNRKLNTAIDAIHDKFGTDKIIPGTLLKK